MNNTAKRVFAKLAKEESVELKAEKVKLNVVNDLDKVSKSLNKAVNKGARIKDNMNTRRGVVEQVIDDVDQLRTDLKDSVGVVANIGGALQDLLKLSDNVEKAAKEFGIDPMEIKGVKEALKIQSIGMDLLKELEAEQKRTENTLKKL